MNTINFHIFSLFFISLLLASCDSSVVGDPLDFEAETVSCQVDIEPSFSLKLPCEWQLLGEHPEQGSIKTIETGTFRIHYTSSGVPPLTDLVDPQTTYFYPVLGGTMIFVDEVLDGQAIIAVYFEGEFNEGLGTRLRFWYDARDDSDELREILLTLGQRS